MKLRNRILSVLLFFIYALSTAHGAIPHSHDDGQNHHHHEEEHQENGSHHHHHHHEDGQHLLSVTKGILHSVAHFIESLGHHHSDTDDNIVLESTDLTQYSGLLSSEVSVNPIISIESQSTNNGKPLLKYAQIYLIHCPLRGPPSFV